jgi:ATP-dependent helicase/nuclease subunit B
MLVSDAPEEREMPLRLIVGPHNSGRAGEVLRRLREGLERDPVLVVPTGDDAAWFERELCAGGRPTLGVSIRTFGWLFDDVAAALALEAGPALTAPQRLALLRAAISTTELRRLRRSARRPGFAPALDSLIEELQAALVTPAELAERARELEDGAHEAELAELYRAYVELRERSGRTDRGGLAAATLAALRAAPDGWGERPVLLYGFDDLTVAQRELIELLARSAEVTVALNYADRRSLAARATLVSELRERGGELEAELDPDADHTPHRSLRHLDRGLFEPGAGAVEPDEGLVLMECAGERGEAEAIGLEIARLLRDGADPGEIAVVVRHPSGSGQVLADVLSGYGIPVALEAQAPVDRTGVGRALVALCRAAGPDGSAEDLLAHLRADPTVEPRLADGVEKRIRRGEARSADEAVASWSRPPRHLARLRRTRGAVRLQALAAIAREIAEGAHRERAPLAASGAATSTAGMLHPLELRAAVAAAELCEELAALGELPGCPEPGLEEAVEALEGAAVPTWRGPTDGRVRILSPYRLRAGRARYLFCAGLQDGEFPAPSPPDPLLGDDRRGRLGFAALSRRDQADEERYLFAACVSRPTERLYLSWRSCDDEGAALARSPFIDEVLDLIAPTPPEAERRLTRSRGLEQVVPAPGQAPSERELARSLAALGEAADPARALAAVGVEEPAAGRVLAALAAIPDPEALPGPLRVPIVLEALGERSVLSANQLESWLECPYRWFVEHELQPVRLEPESDPLWLGGVVHAALANLYGEAPGEEAIPRPGDVGRWRRRFAELLDEAVGEARLGPERVAALARAREQVERFLEEEAASETLLRPRADLLERGFGMDDEDDPGGLELGEFTLRGRIDRIDLAPDGAAVVRDYKTGAQVIEAAKFAEKGSLQIQLYMRVAEKVLELDVIGGLYQPLGATRPGARRPRGLVLKDDERLAGLELVRGGDHCDPGDFTKHLNRAEEQALASGRELRAGAIDRRPLGGTCPRYCTFQPICRLERAIGLPREGENGNGGGAGE